MTKLQIVRETLLKHNCLEEFVKNVNSDISVFDECQYGGFFTWSLTPQREIFWGKIYDELERKDAADFEFSIYELILPYHLYQSKPI